MRFVSAAAPVHDGLYWDLQLSGTWALDPVKHARVESLKSVSMLMHSIERKHKRQLANNLVLLAPLGTRTHTRTRTYCTFTCACTHTHTHTRHTHWKGPLKWLITAPQRHFLLLYLRPLPADNPKKYGCFWKTGGSGMSKDPRKAPRRGACCNQRVPRAGTWRGWATERPAGRTWRRSTPRHRWTLEGGGEARWRAVMRETRRSRTDPVAWLYLSGWSAAVWRSRWAGWCLQWPGSWSPPPSPSVSFPGRWWELETEG